MKEILNPVIVLGGLGLLFGIGLSIASKAFAVKTDPKVDEILNALPGVNCGACGYPGCEGLANGIAKGEAPLTACTVGGKTTADNIADIMGVNPGNFERNVAVVLCQGDCDKAKDKFKYEGIRDCRVNEMLAGGHKSCSFACLGCGTCYDVCPFDAIRMVNGIAVIDKEKCTACMKCIEICPKHIIELMPYDKSVVVKCRNTESGKEVRGKCSVGCIGCQICVRNCPTDAFTFENNLAKINYEDCIECGICVEKCPMNTIHSDKEISEAV